MNLHAISSPIVGVVNPPVFCTLQVSSGYTTAANGTQVPAYQTAVPNVPCQVQALSYTDMMKMGGMNIEGTRRKIYMFGNIEGVDRQAIKGGDLITMPDMPSFPGPTVWLVAQVAEHWPGWSALIVTLQNGS